MWITCEKLWITPLIWGKLLLLVELPPAYLPPYMGVAFFFSPYIEMINNSQ